MAVKLAVNGISSRQQRTGIIPLNCYQIRIRKSGMVGRGGVEPSQLSRRFTVRVQPSVFKTDP